MSNQEYEVAEIAGQTTVIQDTEFAKGTHISTCKELVLIGCNVHQGAVIEARKLVLHDSGVVVGAKINGVVIGSVMQDVSEIPGVVDDAGVFETRLYTSEEANEWDACPA